MEDAWRWMLLACAFPAAFARLWPNGDVEREIRVIFFYSTTLWKAVGFEESSSLTISVFTGLTNIAVTFIAIALIDRIGAAAAQWVANFLVAVTFPSLAAVSLPLTYGMYALLAALSFVFVLTKIPETNGMSLDEASTLLPPRNAAKNAARTAAKETEVRSGREATLRR